ncbi:hypothetical protein [Mucisphaera calidilacus]|uniref:Uncharacterized protein n=1 Tax=Mucisphaera calidilacus TaxID=2527982 RepID=A0A518BZH2_9BACT|nr:hypothetical protein [Mucisphaera calidilacus]QDU72377.1 hypothetical protein Pan265_22420 [Mucisphaera calidilacus]
MPKGQGLSRHQEKIVKRYYEHRDTIALARLQEIVSELYLAESQAKANKLWTSAGKALKNAGAGQAEIDRTLDARDPAKLASLVTRLSRGG